MKIISLNKGSFAFILGLLLWCSHMQANYLRRDSSAFVIQSSVTGTVTDAYGPIPGVYITIKGTAISTSTDVEGKFSIPASKGDILVFAYIGFKTVEVTIKDEVLLTIQLIEDATALKELEINAGYYSVKDKERTGSIARITAKDIETQPVANVLATMQGRMAGVDIIQDGGSPAGGFRVRIRGQNSLRAEGNEPLYIIDGVPYSSETVGSFNTSTAIATPTSPLTNINPSDISSIEVLKDADATAIYGSRGANGVVLITTRKGKAGKTTADFTASTSMGKVTRLLDLLNTEQYLAMRRKAFENDGITQYPDNAYDLNGTWDQNRYTDWQKELIGGTATIKNVTGSVSGGTESTQFLLSASLRNETTVFPGDFEYNKAGVHLNTNHLSQDKKFRINVSANYTYQDNNQPGADLTLAARTLAPNAPALYDANGELNWENSTFENPLAQLRSKSSSLSGDLVANALVSYELLPGLEVKSSLGFTSLKNDEMRTTPSTIYNPALGLTSQNSSLFTSSVARKSWIIEPQLSWTRQFNKLQLIALVGATAQSVTNNNLQQYGSGFTSNSLIEDIASANNKYITLSDEIVYRYQAFFSRLNISWDNKYLLNLTGRRDGSSRFGPANRFANFGAIGGAWIFSKEDFLQQNKVLSFGKLRASYGTSGNDQIGDYQFLNTYQSLGKMYQGYTGLVPSRLFNPDFGWEINRKFEVALETGFLKDRIFLTAAYYRNRSSSQLIGLQLPRTTGFASISGNLDATVQNSGWEFTLRTENFTGKDFSWSTSLNIAAARNKLLSFPGLEGSSYSNTYVIGQSINIAKLYTFEGMDSQSGLYTFKDYNNDGLLSDPDRQHIADLTPKYFGGLHNQLRYKQLSLDFLFQFAKQDNYDYASYTPSGTFSNQRTDVLDAWQKAGDVAAQQLYTTGANGPAVQAYYNYLSSNNSIVDGSYVRLKNIALSYDLPLDKETFKCRLFLQGQNILTFTSYKGGDPEFRYSGYIPPLKLYTMGVQLTF